MEIPTKNIRRLHKICRDRREGFTPIRNSNRDRVPSTSEEIWTHVVDNPIFRLRKMVDLS
jgi:hypothetical protein